MLDLLTTVARRWRVFVAVILLGVGAATLATHEMTPTYRATSQLFVALSSGDSAVDLNQGATFSSQRVKSYPDIVDSPLVLGPVIDELGLDETPASLAARVSAQVPVNTVLLEVSVDDTDPAAAAEVANAVSAQLATVVEDLDRTSPDRESPVRVSQVRPAVPPTQPRTPVPALNLGLGLLAGIVLGVAAAALREGLDNSIKTEADVADVTGLATLGLVPTNQRINANPVIAEGRPDPVWSESYRKLRTNISYLDPDHPPRTLLVTSALPGDGKTVTAANLAASLGQSGRSTVLVEADLRRPALARLLGLIPDVGLTTVVAGRLSVPEVTQSCPGFDVITCGPVPPNPSELLGSQAFSRIIEELLLRYDNVVLDTPPLIAVTDAAVAAVNADAVIVVARARRTHKQHLRRALDSLGAVDARVAGVVLNQVAATGDSYQYYDYTPREAPGRRVRGRSPRPRERV